jgi:PhnB protein
MDSKAVPEGHHTLTAYLAVDDAASAIDWYRRAFGARERVRIEAKDGTIAHAALAIGDSVLMLSDPVGEVRPPTAINGTTATLFMYVDDVDAVVDRAVSEGATVSAEVADQFWGDRFGTIIDPYGHHWSIATHIEDLTPEELGERAKVALVLTGGRL